MPKKPRSPSLPYAPLTFSDVTTLAPPDVPGTVILSELEGEDAYHAWSVVRALVLFATREAQPAFCGHEALKSWERSLLGASVANAFLKPLAVIVEELAGRGKEDRSTLCSACLAMAELALQRKAVGSALCFFEAAALCWPQNARYAMIAGRAFKTYGRLREAGRWLRRARALSRWSQDWETHVLSTSSLGMLGWTEGAPARARRFLHRARYLARRHHLSVIEGEILHNLLVVAITTEDHRHVVEYARGALERYFPDHPRLLPLAYDLAYYWMTRGHTGKALIVFRELLGRFDAPSQQLQVLAATARAGGACHDRPVFEECWNAALEITERTEAGVALPAAMIDLGLGAAHVGDWERSRMAFTAALRTAQRFGLSEELIRADVCLAATQQERNPDTLARPAGATDGQSDTVVRRFVDALQWRAPATAAGG